MSIFVSANQLVGVQYDRLAEMLFPCLPTETEIDREVIACVSDELKRLAPDIAATLPEDGSYIDEKQARYLLVRFAQAVSLEPGNNKRILSAGGVSFNFSCLVYCLLGPPNKALQLWQYAALRDLCAIADMRPLPVKQWTAFVRENMYDHARLRTVMRSCVYSKARLSARLRVVVEKLSRDDLRLPHDARILAIGSSGTVGDALKAIRKICPQRKLFSTRPTPGMPFDREDLGDFDEISDTDLLNGRGLQFNLVVMGCGVIGITNEHNIEIVNWAHDVRVATHVRNPNSPLAIIGGRYKIWPQPFYHQHKDDAVNLRKESLAASDSIIKEKDFDWLVTEHEAIKMNEPRRPPWMEFLFEARSLDVSASLSLCRDEQSASSQMRKILEDEHLQNIDRTLGRIKGVPFFLTHTNQPPGDVNLDELSNHATLDSEVQSETSAVPSSRSAVLRRSEEATSTVAPYQERKLMDEPREIQHDDDVRPQTTPDTRRENQALGSAESERVSIDWEILDRLGESDDSRMLEELAWLYEQAGIKPK